MKYSNKNVLILFYMFSQMNRYPRLREETERIITTYIREKEQVILGNLLSFLQNFLLHKM